MSWCQSSNSKCASVKKHTRGTPDNKCKINVFRKGAKKRDRGWIKILSYG